MKPNPIAVIVKPIDKTNVMIGGIILPNEKDTKQHQVMEIGSKVDKRLDLTLNSKVIISGGIPIIIDNVQYVVVKDENILAVI